MHGVVADIEPQKRAQAERLELLRRLADAQEDEQRRIARELHDQVGQTVTGLSLGLKTLEASLEPGHAAADQVRWLQCLAGDIGRDIHRAASDLRPTALDDLGLEGALGAFARDWSERSEIVVDLQCVGIEDRLPPEVETAIYRVVQEALTNILKHADAHSASIVVERRGGRVRAIIEDDGIGFDPVAADRVPTSAEAPNRAHLGLKGIRERLALLGGALTVEAAPGAGTTLFVDIPLKAGEEA
jgi:signal transduction histidine kinase